MEIDYAAEWQRLTRLYAEMCDEELRELAAGFGDLTEMAQQVLRGEMTRRGMGEPGGAPEPFAPRGPSGWRRESEESTSQGLVPPSQWETALALPVDEDDSEETDREHEYTWKTLLCDCDTREEAWQIYEVLRRAGIESWIEAPRSSYAMESGNPRVTVAADQLDEARQVAAQPIPQEIIDESRLKLPEFEAPRCPRCGASDPVLESVDPCNAWSCEICGNEWAESAEDSNESAMKGGL